VYLKRANLLQSDEDEREEIVTFLQKQIFRRRIPKWCESLGSVVIEAFDVIVKKYSLPKRWNSLTSYLKKTAWGIAVAQGKSERQETLYGKGDLRVDEKDVGTYDRGEAADPGISKKLSDRTPHDLEITVDMIAAKTGYTREHIYRLARRGKIPSSRNGDRVVFNAESLETAKQYADERRKEKDVIQLLVDYCGKTKNAAYRLMQRKKKNGMSLVDIAAEALKGRDRES